MWQDIRVAARFGDIDWTMFGRAAPPGDTEALALLAEHWSVVSGAARFSDIDWQATAGYSESGAAAAGSSARPSASDGASASSARPTTAATETAPRGTGEISCDNITAWVRATEGMPKAGIRPPLRNYPFAFGFRNEVFESFFDRPYAGLSDGDKRRFERTIERCDDIAEHRFALSIPFRRETGSADYRSWMAAIDQANSPETDEHLDRAEEYAQFAARDAALKQQPWIRDYAGDLLYEGEGYTVHRYRQPRLGARPETERSCDGLDTAYYSIVHERDFAHRFDESYLSRIVNDHDLFADAGRYCGTVSKLDLNFFMEDTLFFGTGGLSEVRSLDGLSDFDLRLNNSPFMKARVALNERRDGFQLSRRFTASEVLSVHLDEYEDEVVSVDATLAFLARGRQTQEQERMAREAAARAAAADAACAEIVGPELSAHYAALENDGRPATARLLHCGQFERYNGFEHPYFRDMVASAVIGASDRTCGANTPNGAREIRITTERQQCTVDAWGNRYNCRDVEPRVETLHVDEALMPIYGMTEATTAQMASYMLAEAFTVLDRGTFLPEVVLLQRDLSGVLETAGCAGPMHRTIQESLLSLRGR